MDTGLLEAKVIEISHNFDPACFMWLWTKYVTGFNEKYHCTSSIRGRYSRKLWKGNANLTSQPTILLDEQPENTVRAVYICGVARAGYSSHKNYPHNVHAAVLPVEGEEDEWQFEQWKLNVKNGRFSRIPASAEDIPPRFRQLPQEYVSCRIFRWAAAYFENA